MFAGGSCLQVDLWKTFSIWLYICFGLGLCIWMHAYVSKKTNINCYIIFVILNKWSQKPQNNFISRINVTQTNKPLNTNVIITLNVVI